MNCVKCDGQLSKVVIGEITVDKCDRCGGTGNMVRVTSLKDADIHIDTCSVCYGQWLDGGEIEHLKDQGILDRIKKIFK